MLKSLLLSKKIRRVTDLFFSPVTLMSSVWFRYIRSRNVNEMPISKKIFEKVGVFPISDHYYEPLFNTKKHLKSSLSKDRNLPGIDFNVSEQLSIISKFDFANELLAFPMESKTPLTYYYRNGSYPAGDGEITYNMIRLLKPKRIFEVGCGFSTLMIQNALKKNLSEGRSCEHICIEPFEMKWLEQLDLQIVRKKVEDLQPSFFESLESNDLLFIDSSHIIRPQGDVLFEYLEILPMLKSGVVVHIHDIFTPKDYPDYWVKDLNRFWNEQYLLEAFLTNNNQYKVLLAASFLRHHHETELLRTCPVLAMQEIREPGSFWIQRL